MAITGRESARLETRLTSVCCVILWEEWQHESARSSKHRQSSAGDAVRKVCVGQRRFPTAPKSRSLTIRVCGLAVTDGVEE